MKTMTLDLLLALLVVTVSSASAATITVDWSGSGDYTTIQQGIDAADPRDTVLVAPGTYSGSENRDLSFGGVNLVLMSQAGYAATVIDCEDAGRGLLFGSGEDTTSVVLGFAITHAAADSGAGAFCGNGSDPRFESCLFLDNTAQMMGGGLCCLGSSPIIRECRFEENTADEDGSSDGYGGGLACLQGASPLIVDTEFVANAARYSGGGMYAYYAPLTCGGCTFVGNNVLNYGNEGGGAALTFSDGAAFAGCAFVGNGAAMAVVGGGLYVGSSAVTVTDCEFLDNVAGNGGAMDFAWEAGGTVSGCTFAGNTTVWGACGGVACYTNSNPTIINCTFADNRNDHIWCQESSPTIEYSILAFASPGLALRCTGGTETPHVHHCFLCMNAGGDTLCGENYHDIEYADPLFCDRAGGEFTLCENSPCLPGETWPSLVGAHGDGCPPCESGTEPTSWGAIKAIYR
jgi:hypothetical protein